MKIFKLTFVLVIFLSCKKEKFEPTVVLIGFKKTVTTEKLFEFINFYNFDVEYINGKPYYSSLSPDSLNYIEDYLNTKNYTNDGQMWFINGHLDYSTNKIYIVPYLFEMHKLSNQTDWLKSIDNLKFKEKNSNGFILKLFVPNGKEEEWVKTFRSLDFVEWSELNYYNELEKN